jgi:hypothetical protein
MLKLGAIIQLRGTSQLQTLNQYGRIYRDKEVAMSMDFSESLHSLTDRVQKVKNGLTTEEATKTALVMPFIRALGYDVFNPLEVMPEFTADIAGKKGEKVDYAIMQDDKPIMIIECKACGTNLIGINRDQLHRYFLTLDSCIGILTDGIHYLFFSTSDDGKNMDATPFMEVNLENIDPTLIPELRKLCKGKFDLKKTQDAVAELKFNRQVKLVLASNLEAPDMDFVDYLLLRAGIKGLYKKTKEERYTPWAKRAFMEFIEERVDGRLKTALAASSIKDQPAPEETKKPAPTVILGNVQGDGIDTTEDEIQAYYLAKAILAGVVEPGRIFLRDGIHFCNVLLDNSIQKPLLRLCFNNAEKLSIELIGQNKEKTPYSIENVDDILKHADAIRATARMYLAPKHVKGQEES